MRLTNLWQGVANRLGMVARKARHLAAGVAILAGGMCFVGEAEGVELILACRLLAMALQDHLAVFLPTGC